MAEATKLNFALGQEAQLPKGNNISVGTLYHCEDTRNTYIGWDGGKGPELKLWATGKSANDTLGLVKSGGNATINNGIINVKGVTATALDLSGGKTIANLQTQLKKWLANHVNTPGACCTFVGTLSDVMAKWSNTANTFSGGATNTVHLETLYSHNDYALLRFTSYANKEVYYAAISNNTWGSMYKAAFKDEIITNVIAGNGLTGGGSANSSTGVTLNIGQGKGITVAADTVSHADTSNVSNLTASGRKYVTGLTFDTFGHVTGYTTGTETVVDTDTKNTAGATNIDSKLFLIGATSQDANPQTYSHDTAYVGTDGHLYSNNSKVFSTSYAPEAHLQWGGKNLSGSISPIDLATSSIHSANRLAFANPAGIITEYSRDGGTTWETYTVADADKVKLVSGIGAALYIGGRTTSTTVNDKLRITLKAGAMGVYTSAKKILLNISTNYSTGSNVIVEGFYKGDQTYSTLGTYSISGWSGWNSIPFNKIFGSTDWSYSEIRLTFGITGINSAQTANALAVLDILMFGEAYWTTPSTLAKTNHLYSYDASQNATFPSQVTATKFNGPLNGNAATATSATKADSITVTTLDLSAGKTVANIRTQLSAWVAKNYGKTGVACTFGLHLPDVVNKWNAGNTTATIADGATNTVYLDSYYSWIDYALLRITNYYDKCVYYTALVNGTWQPMRQVAFDDDLSAKMNTSGGIFTGGVSIGAYSGTNGGLKSLQVRNIAIVSTESEANNLTGAKAGDIVFITG